MVGGAADGVREDSVILADAGDVGPEVWLKFFGDRVAAVFGAEDDVEGVLRVGVRHGVDLGRFISCGAGGFERDDGSCVSNRDAVARTCEACIAPTALGILFAIVPRPSGLR